MRRGHRDLCMLALCWLRWTPCSAPELEVNAPGVEFRWVRVERRAPYYLYHWGMNSPDIDLKCVLPIFPSRLRGNPTRRSQPRHVVCGSVLPL
jgi:hypothetical protein